MDWLLISIILLVPACLGYFLYTEHKASLKRQQDRADRFARAESDRRIYEESVQRMLSRSSSSRPVSVGPARSVTRDESSPTPQPDNTSSTLAALALSDAFDSPAPSHTPSYDSSPSYDSGSSSTDCGSSYDSGSSSSSDCGGSSGGGGD